MIMPNVLMWNEWVAEGERVATAGRVASDKLEAALQAGEDIWPIQGELDYLSQRLGMIDAVTYLLYKGRKMGKPWVIQEGDESLLEDLDSMADFIDEHYAARWRGDEDDLSPDEDNSGWRQED